MEWEGEEGLHTNSSGAPGLFIMPCRRTNNINLIIIVRPYLDAIFSIHLLLPYYMYECICLRLAENTNSGIPSVWLRADV